MLDGLDYDGSELPEIGLVPAGVSWDDVREHVKIGRSPLLVLPEGSDEYAGAYWTRAAIVVVEDLGPDQEEAISAFRDVLRQRGEA